MRFSEDIDFDNRGLSEEDFTELGEYIASALRHYGMEVEVRSVFKGAFHCYIRIPRSFLTTGYQDMKKKKY